MSPFQKELPYKMKRLFAKNIKTIFVPAKRNIHILRPIKDKFCQSRRYILYVL